MTMLSVYQLTKTFKQSIYSAVKDVSFDLKDSEILTLVGPSGCGKTTTLRLIAGLERPDAGEVRIKDRLVASRTSFIPPEARGVGMVFQDHALFPHLDVHDNIAFGLVEAGWGRQRSAARVRDLLHDLGLEALARRRVDALSGGERQRVALARALAPQPAVLLLDEPLASLDRGLRERLAEDLAERLRRPGLASVLVTHDLDEAATVAADLVLLRGGRVIQSGPVTSLVANPADAWVARFVGHPNVFDGPERQRMPPLESLSRGGGAGEPGDALWLRDDLVRLAPEAPGEGTSERHGARLLNVRPQRGGLRLELHVPAWDVRVIWRGAARELPPGLREGDRLVLEVPARAWRRLPAPLDDEQLGRSAAERRRSLSHHGGAQ
jgi:ABC-type Fe3+/spermidine/putrescine transport system ATPase subunit